jgi:hypothetical protein
MSAVAITLVYFADSFAAKTNSLDRPGIHPGGARATYHWLCNMRSAAEAERADEVAELAQRVTDKVLLEQSWAAEAACAHA